MKYIHFDKMFYLCRKNSTKQLSKLNENDYICPKDNNKVDELKVKLQFLEKENLLLKEQAKRNKNLIQSILDQNAELLKLNASYINNSISQWVESGSRNNEKNQKNLSRQILEKLDLKSSQIKDLQDNKENKKHSQKNWKKRKEEQKIFASSASPC